MQYDIFALTRSIYLHWPFCPYKCHFCPFVALAGHDAYMERYHKALKQEILHFVEHAQQKYNLETIYIGGGTPSTYPNELLLDMFDTLKKVFFLSDSTEITLEVNPGTVQQDSLVCWREAGINRLSIGVQSLNDSVLKKLNRHQSVEDVYDIIERAHPVIPNLSVDLILGLPGVSSEQWKSMMGTLVNLPLKHISMYFLMVHEGTALYFNVQRKRVSLPCDDELVDLYYWTVAYLREYGFEQYELSNFARSGFYSRHNTMYWERKPYKAFGIGACSFDGMVRFENDKNLFKYLDVLENKEHVATTFEVLTHEQVYMERVMLGIRRAQGLELQSILAPLTEIQQQALNLRIDRIVQGGFIEKKNGYIKLTPRGFSVEHEIATQLVV